MKFTLTDETRIVGGVTLHRIKRVCDGARGGWVETEGNLSHHGDARVYGDAIMAKRSDGYCFVIAPTNVKGTVVIMAGCRYFSIAKARAHWQETRGNTQLGQESQALVDHLERMAKIAGWIK